VGSDGVKRTRDGRKIHETLRNSWILYFLNILTLKLGAKMTPEVIQNILMKSTIDGEDLLDICKEALNWGLWKITDNQLIPSSLVREMGSDPELDLTGLLYWFMFQDLEFKINGYKSSRGRSDSSDQVRTGSLIDCYAGNETLSIGIRIRDQSTCIQGVPRAFQIQDVLGKPYTNVSSFEIINESEGINHIPENIPQRLIPGHGVAGLVYSNETSRGLGSHYYPILKILLIPLIQLQRKARELIEPIPSNEIESKPLILETESVIVESLEVKVQTNKLGDLVTRPTWWALRTPLAILKETTLNIAKLRFITRVLEQSYGMFFYNKDLKEQPLPLKDELIGRTLWRTAVKNPCIKIQARLKRKVERVAKKDNYV
jgi:hypothetical protein